MDANKILVLSDLFCQRVTTITPSNFNTYTEWLDAAIPGCCNSCGTNVDCCGVEHDGSAADKADVFTSKVSKRPTVGGPPDFSLWFL